jgi:hypothetical protein
MVGDLQLGNRGFHKEAVVCKRKKRMIATWKVKTDKRAEDGIVNSSLLLLYQ